MNCLPRLAEYLTVGELPNRTREGLVIRSGVEVDILKCLRHQASSLRVVSILNNLLRVDVHVVPVVQVNLDSDLAWKVELRVKCAGAVATLN